MRWRAGWKRAHQFGEGDKCCRSGSGTNEPKKGAGRGVLVGMFVRCHPTAPTLVSLICLVRRIVLVLDGVPGCDGPKVGDR